MPDKGGASTQSELTFSANPMETLKQRLSIRGITQWAEVTRPSYPLHVQELIGSRPGRAWILKVVLLEALG